MNTESTSPGPATPPAGWYPDGSGGQRWWNGLEWTADYQPPTAAPQAPVQVPAQAQPNYEPEQAHWQPTQAYPAAPVIPPAPRRSRKGLAITLIAAGAVVVLGMVAGAGFLVNSLFGSLPSGSNINPGLTETPLPEKSTEAPTNETAPPKQTEKSGKTPSYTDILAERDQFIKDQKLPLDGSVLKPVTDAQKEYIAELTREYTELNLALGEQDVSVALALSADACETSILNGHEVTESTARTHALTSPLIAQLVNGATAEKRQAATNGLMKTAVLGVSYMCPTDHSQWSTAFNTINGSW